MDVSFLDRLLFFGVFFVLSGAFGLRVFYSIGRECYWHSRYYLANRNHEGELQELRDFIALQSNQLADMERKVKYVKSQEKITSAFRSHFLYCGVVSETDAEIIAEHIPGDAFFSYEYLGVDDFTFQPLYLLNYEPNVKIASWLDSLDRQLAPIIEGDDIPW